MGTTQSREPWSSPTRPPTLPDLDLPSCTIDLPWLTRTDTDLTSALGLLQLSDGSSSSLYEPYNDWSESRSHTESQDAAAGYEHSQVFGSLSYSTPRRGLDASSLTHSSPRREPSLAYEITEALVNHSMRSPRSATFNPLRVDSTDALAT